MQNIDLASFSFDYSEIVKGAAEVKQRLDELKKEQKELNTETEEGSKQFVKNAADIKNLNREYNQHLKYLSDASKETSDQAQRTEVLNAALSNEATTIKGLRDQNKILNQLRNSANITTEEGRLELERLNAQLDANNAKIKENVDQYTQQKINIGNYTQSIKQAFAEMEKEKKALEEKNEALALMQEETKEGTKEWAYFNQQIQQNNQQINILVTNMGGVNEEMQASSTVTKLLSGDFKGLSENAKAAGGTGKLLISTLRGIATSIMGVVKASLAFIATPIGAVIAAVGLVLGSIVNYLKSTQEGIDLVTKVTRPLTAILESLVGVLQEVGRFLLAAFTNPKKSIEDVYNFVKDRVIRTFENLYDIIVGIATLDFKQAKKGFQGLADQAMADIAAIKGAATAVGEFFEEAIQKGLELDRLEKELEQTRIDNTLELGKQAQLFKDQNKIAEDTTKTLEEREKAVQESIKAAERINQLKQKELQLEIDILKNKQSRNDTTREEELALAELLAKQNELNAQEAEMTTTQQNKLNTIRREANAKANAEAAKALDARLKKENEQIELFKQQQLDGTAKTLQQELEINQMISDMKLKQLDNQLKAQKISQEQYAREVLAIQQGLARMEAEIAVDSAQRELQAYRRSFEEQMNERRFLSDAVVAEKVSELDRLMEKEMEYHRLRLEQGLINQQEFDDAIFELTEANRLAIAELNKEREEVEKQEAIELRALEFEEELERMLAENATRFEIEQAQLNEQFEVRQNALDEQLAQGLISQELYNARMEQIARERARAEAQIEARLAQQKMDFAMGLLDAAGAAIDKESKAGKAIALAKAAMNMYQGISAGVALGFPMAIPAVAFASATGLKAIKDITATKIPSATGSGDVGGAMTGPVSSAMNLTGQGVNLGSANTNVQNQVEQQANQANMTEQISEAVQAGAKAGTEQGSQEGITNLSANRQIMQESEF